MKRSTKLAIALPPLLIVGALVGVIATTATINAIATRDEAARIESYGQLVPVGGRDLNVVVSGEHEQTIVLMPGLGTAAPGLDFAPLIEELDDTYRVVAVEPFGTGLSDQTDVPRTAGNIAAEVHEALQQLGIDRYVLAGHSISALYALSYVEAYRDEVLAFVGIDGSVPDQPGGDEPIPTGAVILLHDLGISRVLRDLTPDPDAAGPYDEATRNQIRMLEAKNTAAPTMIDEMDHAASNFAEASGRSLASDLPLLSFVRIEDLDVDGWVELHEAQAASVERGEVVRMTGDHYLHRTRSADIAAGIRAFLTEVAPSGSAG
ncbi:MAG: alpha/beta hydrolase [Microbacterium arborescens]